MCTTIIEEEWRDIAGYEGIYQVSNLGRVKSLNYLHHKGKVCIMSPVKEKSGYIRCLLYNDEGRKAYSIHRLVAMAFCPNDNNYPCVNHKDEDKSNNRADNLEWCTYDYNNKYGTRTQKMVSSQLNRSDLSRRIICIENGIEYESIRDAGRKTAICRSAISKCLNKKHKTAGGYHWKYVD